MAKKPDKPRKQYDNESYRKPRRMAGVPNALAEQLARLAKMNATDFTEEVRRAVREYLERANLWPPPDDADGGD